MQIASQSDRSSTMRLRLFYILVLGYSVWLRTRVSSDGVGWQDDTTGFSSWSYTNVIEYFKYYYSVYAGRFGQEGNLILLSRLIRFFDISVLSIPWFSIRLFEAALQLFAFGNFFRGSLRISGVNAPREELMFYGLGFLFFALNSTLSQAMSLVLNISNYTTPIFIYSLIFLKYTKNPSQSLQGWKLVLLSMVLFYIGLCHEQLLFFTGMITLTFVMIPFFQNQLSGTLAIRRFIWVLSIYVPVTLIHFLSPGNLSRLATYNPDHHIYAAQWRTETGRTWLKLFHLPDWHASQLSWILLIGFVFAVVLFVRTFKKTNYQLKSPDQTLVLMGLGFVSAAVLMHSSLLSTGYFPERARTMPMIAYLVGTFLIVLFGIRYRFTRALSAGLAILMVLVCFKAPQYFSETWVWWNAWDQIGGRAKRLYTMLVKEVKKTNRILVFEMDNCGPTPSVYDSPETAVNMLKWLKIEDRVEVKYQKKIQNPKDGKLPRELKPVPCEGEFLDKLPG